MKTSEFPAVILARKIAEYYMQYYRKMMGLHDNSSNRR